MSETELERLVVRLVGDNDSYKAMLQQSQAQTGEAAKNLTGQLKNIEGAARGFGITARSSMMIARSSLRLLNADSARAQLQAINTLAFAIGRQFGTVGILAAFAFDAITSHVDKAQAAANKGFLSMVKGAKDLEVAVADIKLEVMAKEFQNVIDKMAPSSTLGKLFQPIMDAVEKAWRKAQVGKMPHEGGPIDLTKVRIQEVLDQARQAEIIMRQLAESPAGKQIQRETFRVSQQKDLNKAMEDYALAIGNVTAAEKAGALARPGQDAAIQRRIANVKEATKMTEQFMLPGDKYNRQVRQADELLRRGLITQGTYNRALQQYQKQLAGIKAELGNATEYGSAASFRGAYEQLLRPGGQEITPLKGISGASEAADLKRLQENWKEEQLGKLDKINDVLGRIERQKGLQPAGGGG